MLRASAAAVLPAWSVNALNSASAPSGSEARSLKTPRYG